MRKRLGIGLIGSGFMGRAHAHAFRSVAGLFDVTHGPDLAVLADRDEATAKAAADALGFKGSTGDWRALVTAPQVDVVAITAPNALHEEMGLAALAAGKHVYCEKPLAAGLPAALRMADAAARRPRLVTMVGFNFLRNPMVKLARDIVQSGEIGEIISFRGIHAEDYMADPAVPHSFRTDPAGGGALNDIGSHIISMSHYLIGPIEAVCGHTVTVHAERPRGNGRAEVAVDDRAVFLARFSGGMVGSLEANWAASGRKMQLEFEIVGTKGTIAFDQSRFNELHLYESGQASSRAGFRRIEAGPAHPPYGAFCPAPGHQIGFNDLKVIEVAELIAAIGGGTKAYPDFADALAVLAVTDAVHRSAAADAQWMPVAVT